MKQKYIYLILSLSFASFIYSQQATHLNFDGNNDLVNCGNNSSVQITGNQITLEAWVRAESFKPTFNDGTIINKEQNGFMSDNGYMIRVGGSGQVNFNIGDGSWHEITSPTNSLTVGTWHHLAATYDGATMIIYVDGNIVSSSTSFTGNIGNSTADLRIGNVTNLSRCFDGDIDEVRIWNIVRTQTEIQNNMDCVSKTSSGLVAYYKFNQGITASNNASETILFDETINENNGLLSNFTLNGTSSNWLSGSNVPTLNLPTATSPIIYQIGDTASALTATSGETGLLWYTTATGGTGSTSAPTPSTSSIGSTSYWVSSTNTNGCESNRVEIIVEVNPIPPGSYLNFDGTGDRITGVNTNLPQGNSPRTIETWVRNSTGNDMTIFNYGNVNGVNNQIFTLHLYNGIYIIGYFNDISTGYNINDGNWHHVAVSHDGTNTRIYVDGNLINTTAKTYNTNGYDFQIGTSFRNGSYLFDLSGSLDEIRIWNYARTLTEINDSKDCELTGNETGLVAYYQFNEGLDQADNSTVTILPDLTSNGNDGTLTNFTLNGATSNWLAGSLINSPEVPTVTTPVIYSEGDTASPLTANSSSVGLMWYTVSTGGTGSTTSPTPSTATAGLTSYWVASTNANGCESDRVEIVVQVDAVTNDDCANATSINVGLSFSDFPENVDLTGATDSGVSSLWCGYYQGGDRWYTAVIPSSGNIIIETNGGSYYDTVLEIYAGVDCNSLFDIDCDDNNGTDDYSKVTLTGAPAGETIYIRVYEYGTANSLAQFQISAYEPYYNICSSTTALTVGTSFSDFPVNVDLTGETDSGVLDPGCASYSGGDKWFTAVIPASGDLIIETDGSNGDDTGLAVYFGNCDNGLIIEDCNDDHSNGGYSKIELSGYTPGETVYIRVWEYSEGNSSIQFEISAYEPYYNVCSSTALTVGAVFSDNPMSVDLSTAITSGASDPGCASYAGGDQWFTAIIPASGNLTIETDSTNGDDTGMAVYTGNCDNALVFEDCNDDGGNGTYSMIELNGYTPGETVYIRVWEYDESNSSIQFEISAYDASLSNESFLSSNILIYPNPSHGVFTINSDEELEIKVFDLVGKLIFTNKISSGINQIDISNYSSGIYLLQCTTNNESVKNIKLIKN